MLRDLGIKPQTLRHLRLGGKPLHASTSVSGANPHIDLIQSELYDDQVFTMPMTSKEAHDLALLVFEKVTKPFKNRMVGYIHAEATTKDITHHSSAPIVSRNQAELLFRNFGHSLGYPQWQPLEAEPTKVNKIWDWHIALRSDQIPPWLDHILVEGVGAYWLERKKTRMEDRKRKTRTYRIYTLQGRSQAPDGMVLSDRVVEYLKRINAPTFDAKSEITTDMRRFGETNIVPPNVRYVWKDTRLAAGSVVPSAVAKESKPAKV